MENNITVNIENLSEKERDQMMRLIEKSNKPKRKIWKPECNECYFYVTGFGEIDNHIYDNDNVDNGHYRIGNCFKTKKEAKFALENAKVETELRRFAEENNECEIEWKNESQQKWFIYYFKGNIECNLLYSTIHKDVYFTSEYIAKEAIKHIGEDRLKKYYFGVED